MSSKSPQSTTPSPQATTPSPQASPSTAGDGADERDDLNLAVLRGVISGPVRERDLPSGSHLVELSVTARAAGTTTSTPVSWFDPPASRPALAEGDPVVVVGPVVRRFFQAGGATRSRTEVNARAVVPVRRRATVRRAIGQVVARLTAVAEGA